MASAAIAMLVSRATCAGEAVSGLAAAASEADTSDEVDAARASADTEVTAPEVDSVGAGAIGARVGGTENAEKLASTGACSRQRASRRCDPRTIGLSGAGPAMGASRTAAAHAAPQAARAKATARWTLWSARGRARRARRAVSQAWAGRGSGPPAQRHAQEATRVLQEPRRLRRRRERTRLENACPARSCSRLFRGCDERLESARGCVIALGRLR